MRKALYLILFLVLPFVAVSQPNSSVKNIKISGGLTMTSKTKGLLPPRVTTAERDAIVSPGEGLLVYNTDLSELQFFSGGWFVVGGGGVGDMLKSVYDINTDNIVDNSDKLDAQEGTFYLARTNHTGSQTASTISDFDTEVGNNASVTANTAKVTNVTTNLSEGTTTTTTVNVNSSDGTNATLASASASRAGVMTKAKFDEVVVNNAKVTNATHTGDVTGSGALTIANKAVEIVMLDDGTDGELITWDASGVATTVSAGTSGQVLTSNGSGSEPTFQAAGGDGDGIYSGSGSLSGATTVSISANQLKFTSTIIDGFSVDGTTFSVDANNNRVGIGFASPTSRLNVRGENAASTSNALLIEDNVGTDLFRVRNNGRVAINGDADSDYALSVSGEGTTDNGNLAIFKKTDASTGYISLGGSGGGGLIPTIVGKSEQDGFGLLIFGSTPNDVLVSNQAVIQLKSTNNILGVLETGHALSMSLGNSTYFLATGKNGGGGNNNSMAWNANIGVFDPIKDIVADRSYTFLTTQDDVFGIRSLSHGGDDGFVNSPFLSLIGLYDSEVGAGVTTSEFESTIQSVMLNRDGGIADGFMQIKVDGGAGFVFDKDGHMKFGGVGATTRLVINGVVSSATAFVEFFNDKNTANSKIKIAFDFANSANNKARYSAINGMILTAVSGSENGALTFETTNSGSLGERMRIDNLGNVGIGTTSPAISAKLDISSTTGALLLSRMNTTERDALTAVNGMIIYNSQTNAFNFYENGSWVTK